MLNQSTTASFIPIFKPRLCLHLLRLGPQAILPPHSLPPRTSTWRTHRFKPSGSPASSCPFLVSPPTPRHSFLSLLGLSFSPSSIYLFSDPSSLSFFSLSSFSLSARPTLSSFFTLQDSLYTGEGQVSLASKRFLPGYWLELWASPFTMRLGVLRGQNGIDHSQRTGRALTASDSSHKGMGFASRWWGRVQRPRLSERLKSVFFPRPWTCSHGEIHLPTQRRLDSSSFPYSMAQNVHMLSRLRSQNDRSIPTSEARSCWSLGE